MSYKPSEELKSSISKNLKSLDAGPKEWSGFNWSPWSTLRSILESQAVKSASIWLILTPIILSFTSELPKRYSASPFNGRDELTFLLQIPFNWYLLYFSAVCFGVSRIVYLAYCPEFIKKYGSSASATSDGVTAELVRDYASDYLSNNRVRNPLSPEGERLNKFLSELTGKNNLVGQHSDDTSGENLLQSQIAGSNVREIPGTGTYLRSFKLTGNEEEDEKKLTSILLWKFIDWLEHSRTKARCLCFCLVGIGFLLLAIPLIQGFSVVVRAFARYQAQSSNEFSP